MELVLYIYLSAIIIHIISVFICGYFTLPLQIKEAFVRNGLARLRKELLMFGATIILLGIITVITLGIRFISTAYWVRYIALALIVCHSLGFLFMAILGARMYHSEYTDENKRIHEQIDQVTHGRARIVAKK